MTRIWDIFLRGTEHSVNLDSEDFKSLCRNLMESRGTRLNGRKIRNMWQSAMLLATQEKNPDQELPTLERKHFEIVAKAAQSFNNYMRPHHPHPLLREEASYATQ